MLPFKPFQPRFEPITVKPKLIDGIIELRQFGPRRQGPVLLDQIIFDGGIEPLTAATQLPLGLTQQPASLMGEKATGESSQRCLPVDVERAENRLQFASQFSIAMQLQRRTAVAGAEEGDQRRQRGMNLRIGTGLMVRTQRDAIASGQQKKTECRCTQLKFDALAGQRAKPRPAGRIMPQQLVDALFEREQCEAA